MASVKQTPTINGYADGSCLKPGEHGAWAYLLLMPDGQLVKDYRATESTTNNRMELSAVIECLGYLDNMSHNEDRIVMHCDSQYVVRGAREWRYNWKARGWTKSDGKPVKNVDLWQKLDGLLEEFRDLRFQWVKGHAGNNGNEVVDDLCHTAAKNLRDGI